MKIFVTGVSGGLGNELYQNLVGDVVGLARKDFDISTDDGIDDIVDLVTDEEFDVFINCAYDGYGQTDLLYQLFRANADRKCHIINVGSVSSDGDRMNINEYAVAKSALEKASTQLSLIESKCKVSLIKPGRMNTKMVAHQNVPKMSPSRIATAIQFMIDQPAGINIKSLTIDLQSNIL